MRPLSNSINSRGAVFGVVMVCLFGLPVQARYSGGTGELNNPYLIATAEDLNDIDNHPNDMDKHFILMNDIDLSGYTGNQFNIIGHEFCCAFIGVFDGNGHTIRNFSWSISGSYDQYIGIFGGVYAGGVVKNLRVEDAYINAQPSSDFVGVVVGFNDYSSVLNCHASGVVEGSGNVGGLVGYSDGNVVDCSSSVVVSGDRYGIGGLVGICNEGVISNCYSLGEVFGEDYVGGLVGSSGDKISNCYSASNVAGGHYCAGGLVGESSGEITNCYSLGAVDGNDNVGGLVGRNVSWNGGLVYNCYSGGSISGNTDVGGLVGYDSSGVYGGCFWDSDVNPDVNGIGNTTDPNVIGETTANMQTESTFTDAGWDFVGEVINGPNDVWTICEGEDYPRLAWEKYGGGNGTEANPYLIRTSCQMNAIGADSNDWDAHFELMADIDLGGYTGTSFNIIGNSSTKFAGAFDGNGHTIHNFTWASANDIGIGLFGYVDSGGEVKNLQLENVDVNVVGGNIIAGLAAENDGNIFGCVLTGMVSGSESWVAGLVARHRGIISDCHVRGSVSSVGTVYGNRVGGLVGKSYSGSEINGCSSECTVAGDWGLVGGLVGENWSVLSDCSSTGDVFGVGADSEWVGGLIGKNVGTVMNCYSTARVSGVGEGLGGLVGCTYSQIMDSYSSGSVSGIDRVGGLVGRHQNGQMSNCYSVGSVSGNSDVGGLVGYYWGGAGASYTKCFWDSDVAPDVNGIGNTTDPNVIGETTANMQTESTFTDAGWDFVGEVINGPNDVWTICEWTNYPKFVWQIPAADFVCPDGVNFIDYAFFAEHWLQAIYGECGGVELTGDGKVNWVDFTLFAEYWKLTGCGDCGGADFTGDENVDLADLYVFATYWLGFEYAEVDLTNDGQVDLDDLREFTENWLAVM